MEHNVDMNARDIEGWTPLHAAAATGNIQMINLLVTEGASLVALNNDDKMPIDVAADSDIKYILQQKMIEAGKGSTSSLTGHNMVSKTDLYIRSKNQPCLSCCCCCCCFYVFLHAWRKA